MAAPYPNAAPSSKLIFEKSSFLHKNSRHEKFITEHYFNASVSMLLPGETIPEDIPNIFQEDEAYIVHKLPLLRLIDKEFIEAFVKKGSMYMLSHQTQLDCHDCVALLPSGMLVLNLTKDTYEQLGIEGKPSKFTARHSKPSKYVVQINLTAEYFTPGKKNYNRVWWCLKDRLNLVFDFLTKWTPQDDKICPSSIQHYFEKDEYDVSVVSLKPVSKLLHDRLTPEMNDYTVTTTDNSYKEFYEWLGAAICDVKLDCEPDDYLSTYRTPDPSSVKTLGLYRVTGVISPHSVSRLLEVTRNYITKESKVPWAAITVHGFSDSPVSWSTHEHGYYMSGDNLYTYVVFPDHQYWLYSALSTYDEGY